MPRISNPCSFANVASIKIRADDPSLILEALPPVTVPFSLNIVFKVDNFSTLLFDLIPSSEVISLPSASVIFIISLSNLPSSTAFAALA